jgi:NifB/MoaA-like Fe-S oxidoreductase
VIAQVEQIQAEFQSQLGSRFAWLSDEWYLMAGLPLPPRADYEDFPQQEMALAAFVRFWRLLIRLRMNCPKL